jgi:hypothetical protein
MKQQNALIIGLSIVASAVIVTHGFKPAEAAFGGNKYVLKTSGKDVAWRMNTDTGETSVCILSLMEGVRAKCANWSK